MRDGNKMECKYKPVERVGLYIMIIILLLFGPCSMDSDHDNIKKSLERIEDKLGIWER